MANILILGSEGYIATRLKPFLEERGHTCDGFDRGYYSKFPSPSGDMKYLPADLISIYDVVICLAGHSSVPLCQNDPIGSMKNNVLNFQVLLEKVRPEVKLVYASSGSVYSGSLYYLNGEEVDDKFSCVNHYDLQKLTIDRLAQFSGKRTYGLRFGTVCGNSPNPRLELLVNSMYCDAVDTGVINVANAMTYRSVLGMRDLCRAISAIVEQERPPGIYNIASFKDNMMNIASHVSKDIKAEINFLPDSLSYNFAMSTAKFQKTFDFTFMDTVESILDDLRGLPPSMRKKELFNRSTRFFKYD